MYVDRVCLRITFTAAVYLGIQIGLGLARLKEANK